MASLTRVNRVPNPSFKRSGIKSYAYIMNKYKFQPTKEGPYFVRSIEIPMHPVLRHLNRLYLLVSRKKARQVSQDRKMTVLAKMDAAGKVGHVDADDIQNDSEYLCPVTIGTPGQVFHLDFDTGSSDLWIFSTELPSSTQKQAAAAKHAIFDSKKSSSFKKASDTWKISYGDGSSASGSTGTDTVTVGGVAVQGQVIELAKSLSSEFAQGAGDGLLGLAWPAINTVTPNQAATPVENMMTQKLLTSNLFTAHLASWRQGKNTSSSSDEAVLMKDGDSGKFDATASSSDQEGTSFYTFGGIDADVLKAANATESDIHYADVDNSQGFWQFESTSASVGGKSIDRSGNSAIADTGTTLALVDDQTVEAIYAAIPGATYSWMQQGYVFPSSVTADQLPVVTFAVGDKQFAVPKEALSYADAGSGMVYGGIQSRGSMTFDILGDTFLKGIYAVFDQGNKRFGALQRQDPTGDSVTPPPAQGGQ